MIPLAVPNLAGNEGRYLQECIATSYVSSVGPFVRRFEGMVAGATGAEDAVAVSSGTVGLHLALVLAGVARDDLVVLPALTFIASANAIAHCGALPWLFDVTEESWTLDPAALERALAAETEPHAGKLVHRASGRRVAAIMPVHTLGHPADMDALVAVARRHSLPLVADGAAVLGARYKGRKPARWGTTLTVLSFNGNKTVTAGGGGALCGTERQILSLARHLSTTARVGEDYVHDRVGYNYRMTNLQAAVGCAQMERLDRLVAAKRRIHRRYDEAFAGMAGIGRFPAAPWAESACWFSGIVLDPARAARGAAIRARLRERGIDARPFWRPMHLQEPYRTAPRDALRVTDGLWQRILTLPCSTQLSEEEQLQVIAETRAALEAA
ncbi:MAG: aminotransferase class I/II-fold pyridoxal phosphate-dependent enzyme [Alphaproteobacteria bacterium]|nr:aminotransferase class I/II-fold pyridoxal phosphate-dependent enzyme [Alphaproteobacteria bacterium]